LLNFCTPFKFKIFCIIIEGLRLMKLKYKK
jgi:hypothetical protein